MAWDDRLSWSGESPLNYPGLNPVAALRFDGTDAATGSWADAVDPANVWTLVPWIGTPNATRPDRTGPALSMNTANPATEQGNLRLPYFEGLWPSSGRLLMGLWVKQRYTMAFNPLLSSRSGSPVAYLSTRTSGTPRHSVYGASGSAVIDYYESSPWAGTTGWQWLAMFVDFDNLTSQIASVDPVSHGMVISPARALSGAPNPASTAPLDVFALPGSGYWSGGELDEVMVAHPAADFDLAAYVERIRLGTWARGADADANLRLQVTDDEVVAVQSHTLATGAERVEWDEAPEPSNPRAVAYWSTDDGATWQTGSELPAVLDGLLRWEVPLTAGEQFNGLSLLPPRPRIAELPDVDVPQRGSVTVPLEATWTGEATWTVAAIGLSASVVGSALRIEAGWATGAIPVTVSLRDGWGRTASRTFTANVQPSAWTPPPPPQYPRAPIVLWDDDGPDVAIADALSAVVTQEVNGEHLLEFSLPRRHRHAAAVLSERVVELAGERYRVRRVTDTRKGGAPVSEVYCEALFYDLAYAGQLEAREYLQVPAGTAVEHALEGTGWTIAALTVSTRRTYDVERSSPLERLRAIQKQHGGDLLFDGTARTVSLVAQSGRDEGVAFFYGRGLAESKRVVDTTSLVTRIYARNEEGVTIAAVNDGKPYLEDFSHTDEVREATYNFASGTSPYTMLSMVRATLANRSKPSYSYEFTVSDLSHRSGQEVDRFDVGDVVTVVDDELGIREAQRIVKAEHDVVRPWASKITLSGKLRELGGSSGTTDGDLTTGVGSTSFDVVPFNLLRNARFDNALAHWAASGVEVVEGSGTGDYAVRLQGSGLRWLEQTVQPDNRDSYSLSLDVQGVGGGTVPPLRAIVTVQYEDGSSDSIPVELA